MLAWTVSAVLPSTSGASDSWEALVEDMDDAAVAAVFHDVDASASAPAAAPLVRPGSRPGSDDKGHN